MVKGAIFGALIGLVGGTVGISLGSEIYTSVRGIGLVGEIVGRTAGWAIFGALIGLGQGVVGMSAKRAYYGLIGGLLGGVAGGIAFIFVGSVTAVMPFTGESGPDPGAIPRGIGFSILGMGIGLMIGVVESIGRKAWVRLMLGRNEGKDWALDASATYFGRSENVHVPLFGDPMVQPSHACIRKEGNNYVLYDLQTPIGVAVNGQPTRQAFLNNGDIFQIGHHSLMFMLKGAGKPTYTPQAQHVQFAHPEPGPAAYGQIPAGMAQVPMQPTVIQAPVSMPTVAQSPIQVPTLVALDGPLAGQRYPVTTATEVGREQPTIPMAFDTQASRRHARIEPIPGGVNVTDLGSLNGVYLNNSKISTAMAKIGDLLRIGSTTFRLE
jgi:pSer/pThr/pTyr-binding forkhead associated (FHA) protein